MTGELIRFLVPDTDNYAYALVDAPSRTCLIVDPLRPRHILRRVTDAGLRPVGILITHTHWDHVEGVEDVLRAHPVPVYVHPLGQETLAPALTRTVIEGSTIPFGGESIDVYETPGHHHTHVAYRWRRHLLVGDTLFHGGCGNPLFGGDVEELYWSVAGRIAAMDGSLYLHWGHDYADKNFAFATSLAPDDTEIVSRTAAIQSLRACGTEIPAVTLDEERRWNLFLRCEEKTIHDRLARISPGLDRTPQAVFRELRARRNVY